MSFSPEIPDEAKIAEMRMQIEKLSTDPTEQVRILKLTIDQIERQGKFSPERTREKLDRETEAMGHLFEAIKTTMSLINEYALGGNPSEVIKEGLEKNGLGSLFSDIEHSLRTLQQLEQDSAFAGPIDWNRSNPVEKAKIALANIGAQDDFESSEKWHERRKQQNKGVNTPHKPLEYFFNERMQRPILWPDAKPTFIELGKLQTLVEAIPKEAGLSQIPERDIIKASKKLHHSIQALLQEYGWNYIPITLYQDNFDNLFGKRKEVEDFIDRTHSLAPLRESPEIHKLFPELPHGTIVRVDPLASRGTGDDKKYDGHMDYLQVGKK